MLGRKGGNRVSIEFWNTVMGRQFIDRTAPRLVRAVERIAEVLESQGTQSAPLRSAGERPLMRCSQCGGKNVQAAYWVRVNTKEVMDLFGSWNEPDTVYCENCRDHCPIVEKQKVGDIGEG